MHRAQHRIPCLMMGLLLLLVAPVLIQAQEVSPLDDLADCGYSDLLDEPGLSLGAVVLNIQNGQGCAENLDQSFHVASVPKIFVAGAVYEALSNGSRSPDERITFTEPYWMGGRTDCLTESFIGQWYTPQRLIEFMINCSDNAATWLLMDWLGREQVNAYVESLGIPGIGRIIPYAEVDRAKLAFADSRWEEVPAGMASRYYRARISNGLSTYFGSSLPDVDRSEYISLNQQYFDSYRTNTITPRAMAQYFLLLRQRALTGDPAAINTLDVMLYTQRLYSVQDVPGTVYIGGKNGFDRGLLAEVSVLYSTLLQRIPSGIVIVFGRYPELTP
ncbi:MAG: serine hydrolase, partial [Anaerolineae bacterium]|nr:serine hydrolase [Anaerolineae bacterium]